MPHRILAAIICAALTSGSAADAGAILSPVAVISNTGGSSGSGFEITNTIDQSGLSTGFVSGVTDFDTYLATNPLHSFQTGEWFSQIGPLRAVIVYDLGQSFLVTRMALWNEEAAGILSTTVDISDDVTFVSFSNAGTFAPLSNQVNVDYPAEVFNLAPSVGRFVRMDVSGFAGGSFVSMGEIAFEVSSLPPTPDVVPEPATFAIFGLMGLAAIGAARRRR